MDAFNEGKATEDSRHSRFPRTVEWHAPWRRFLSMSTRSHWSQPGSTVTCSHGSCSNFTMWAWHSTVQETLLCLESSVALPLLKAATRTSSLVAIEGETTWVPLVEPCTTNGAIPPNALSWSAWNLEGRRPSLSKTTFLQSCIHFRKVQWHHFHREAYSGIPQITGFVQGPNQSHWKWFIHLWCYWGFSIVKHQTKGSCTAKTVKVILPQAKESHDFRMTSARRHWQHMYYSVGAACLQAVAKALVSQAAVTNAHCLKETEIKEGIAYSSSDAPRGLLLLYHCHLHL